MKDTKDFYEEQTVSESERDSENKQIRIIILAVIISAVIGAAAGMLMGFTSDNKEDKDIKEIVSTQAPTAVPTELPTQEPEAINADGISTYESIPSPMQTSDLIDIIAEARRNGMSKRCYLTFDDGPSAKVTGQILDILKKYNIKATFFQVGSSIRRNPDMTRRVHSEGHLIANHSYNHQYDSLYMSEEAFKAEVEACESEIEGVIGEELSFKLMRFPGGGYNAGIYGEVKQAYKQTLANMGYYHCDWNVLNGDAEGAKKDAAGLVAFFKTSSESYIAEDKNLIVLMHDTDAKQETVDSLDEIILYITSMGYTFHRLDDI